ncbi:MAG: hypothetical protein ACOWWR_15485 [Eubacteriales bacterium]
MEPNASTLSLLSYHLRKPVSYFFHDRYTPKKNLGELSYLEKEILIFVNILDTSDQKKFLAELKTISNLD